MSEHANPAAESFESLNSGDTVTLPSPRWSLAVNSFGLSDPGKVRKSNEDHFLIASMVKSLQVELTSLPQERIQHSSKQGRIFIVADGMGGHAAGEEASALAIDSVESFVLDTFKWFMPSKHQDQDQVLDDFQAAVEQVNARVLSEAAQRPELHGMGTTLTVAYNLRDELFIAHVGDSRCYLSRKGELHRLTRDHTLVDELVRAGAIAPEDAPRHRLRHVITNTVGGNCAEIQVEVHKARLEAGDRLLLCSDGLTEMVSEDLIGEILESENNPEAACQLLVNRANEAGGKDNITVVIAHFDAA
jgi:serine/threonine protein phosphatase PrpC